MLNANASPGDDTILLGAGIYLLTLVGADEDSGLTGDLDYTDTAALTIQAAVAGEQPVIVQTTADRILDVHLAAGPVTLSGIAFVGGEVTGGGGSVRSESSHPITVSDGLFEGAVADWGRLLVGETRRDRRFDLHRLSRADPGRRRCTLPA